MFSISLNIHFIRCWQGEFGYLSRASLVSDHFLYSCDLNVWLTVDAVRRNEMFCTLRGQTVKTGACRDHFWPEKFLTTLFILFSPSVRRTQEKEGENWGPPTSEVSINCLLSCLPDWLIKWRTDKLTDDGHRQIGSWAVIEWLEALMSRPWWKGRKKVVLS